MKAYTHKKAHRTKGERGQGLVEMALILPFLLVLVVGVVELGVALNRQLTVVNAAREGARFGAQGGTPLTIHEATLRATSDMFQFKEDNAVVVVIRAKTNEDGTAFAEWKEEIYPQGVDVPHVTDKEVLGALREESGCPREGTTSCPDAAKIKLVAVDVEYDHQSMLGLPFVGALAGEIPIGSWTVMRLENPSSRAGEPGCCAYPIAVPLSILQDAEAREWIGDLWSPDNIKAAPGQFGWLRWKLASSGGNEPYLEDCLEDVFIHCEDYQNAGIPPGWVKDPDDHAMKAGKGVMGNSGLSASRPGIIKAMDDLVNKHIRVIVWDDVTNGGDWGVTDSGNNARFLIHGFAIIQITCDGAPNDPALPCNQTSPAVCGGEPYCLKGSQDRLSARFIRWDNECEAH